MSTKNIVFHLEKSKGNTGNNVEFAEFAGINS